MLGQIASDLTHFWNIPKRLVDFAIEVENALELQEKKIDNRAQRNFLKVLSGFRQAGVRESHLLPSHGYGYFDEGREVLDSLYASVFGGEDALVRHQLVSGTHALRCALFGLLRPGDVVAMIPEIPYDTLHPLFGLSENAGSLCAWGVKAVGLSLAGLEEAKLQLPEKTKVVFIQRSKGYAWRDSISIERLERIIRRIKSIRSDISVVVDNCYGEFVEEKEPCDVGADLAVGSLIKNPGGGMAPTGGYIVGKSEAVAKASVALTAPGLGKEVGPTLGISRSFFVGLFLAPQFVGEALKTSLFSARLFERLGYEVLPDFRHERTDIIQAIQLGSREKVLAFARGLQSAGPLEQRAVPEGAPMAGYTDEIVMAGGTFIQGGSLELSCDAPLRSPYIVYLQGGLSSFHGKLGVLLAAREVEESRGAEKRSQPARKEY